MFIVECPAVDGVFKPKPLNDRDLKLMRRVDELYLAHPFAGTRMMRDLLRLEGIVVNRKKVRRLMRKMGLPARHVSA